MASGLSRVPVIVGVGQVSQHLPAEAARAPIELLEDAARAAEADAGAPLLARTDIVAVVHIVSWPYADPGAFLARRLGIAPKTTAVSTVGGNSPQLLVDEMAERIQRGECDVVLIGGAESMHARWRARREPRVELVWETGDDAPCAWVIGDDRPGSSDEEMRHGAVAPTMVYPLFETALRADAGRTIEEHQRHVSELWSKFSTVAAGNPHAWSQTEYSPDEIRTVAPDNRMVVLPVREADVRQHRCRPRRRDHPLLVRGGPRPRASPTTAWCSSTRPPRHTTTGSSPNASRWRARPGSRPPRPTRWRARRSASTTSLTSTSIRASRPRWRSRSASSASTRSRPLTVTGGLGFAGGPVNNYPTHAIAQMVERLRADPDAYGLTTALGWYVTKHAAGVWSARPPRSGFRRVDPADHPGARRCPARATSAGLVDGDVVVEATSVAFDRDGAPTSGIVTAVLPDGRRAIAAGHDIDLLRAFTETPWEGRTVRITNDGSTNTVVG